MLKITKCLSVALHKNAKFENNPNLEKTIEEGFSFENYIYNIKYAMNEMKF